MVVNLMLQSGTQEDVMEEEEENEEEEVNVGTPAYQTDPMGLSICVAATACLELASTPRSASRPVQAPLAPWKSHLDNFTLHGNKVRHAQLIGRDVRDCTHPSFEGRIVMIIDYLIEPVSQSLRALEQHLPHLFGNHGSGLSCRTD